MKKYAIVVLAVAGLGIFLFFGYTKLSTHTNNSLVSQQNGMQQSSGETFEKKKTCQTDFGTVDAPRESAEGAFTSALTDVHAINVISPGKLVGDARFTYLWVKNGQTVPVYAPADGVLVQIFYKTRSDLSSDLATPDYDLVFLVDCHTFYRINHVTNPIPQLADQKPITQPLELKPGSGFDNKDTLPKNAIVVKAGQQIGTTTGTPAARNFDFGVFVDKQAVCPYKEFAEPIRSQFLSLLGNTTNPISGTSCDVSGMY